MKASNGKEMDVCVCVSVQQYDKQWGWRNGASVSFLQALSGLWSRYSAVLVSAAQQSESGMCVHTSPLFCNPFPFRSPWSTELLLTGYVLCSRQGPGFFYSQNTFH